ncbi:hypothetical protein [Thermaerobacter composti]|uniref:Uncharacterized protein n=1 Tax=Thermaerobacter composti TaxID=554949 RepID=A0ABZ0QTL6_9FIRM|nr:hypothetical protein [Thermaerobacter composti]WPD20169.1 hypothetical protein Q5761_05945 [Thermaerobacter composti]
MAYVRLDAGGGGGGSTRRRTPSRSTIRYVDTIPEDIAAIDGLARKVAMLLLVGVAHLADLAAYEYGAKGVALWRGGLEDPQLWTMLVRHA